MSRVRCRLWVGSQLAWAVGVLLAAGCAGGSAIRTEYVEGVVTLDGAPVAEATVTFRPVTEGQACRRPAPRTKTVSTR